MINSLLELLNEPDFNLIINLVTHSIVFIGGFYVAMFNKRLPTWHVTPVWYIGLTSLFTVLTIIFEFIFGLSFPLSHFNMALVSEALLDIALAYLVIIMFIGTYRMNSKNSRNSLPRKE